jgi:hypothetical protein
MTGYVQRRHPAKLRLGEEDLARFVQRNTCAGLSAMQKGTVARQVDVAASIAECEEQ